MITRNPKTLCGYDLADVRRSFCEAVTFGDQNAAKRWTAEMVATPGAIGSLWASYWLAWAAVTAGPSPCIPLLLNQGWSSIVALIHRKEQNWREIRNDPETRGLTTELTMRLLDLPHQTPVAWPTRSLVLFDVETLFRGAATTMDESDTPLPVLRVWKRTDDADELRRLATFFITSLERGEIRPALSAIAWTLLPAQIAAKITSSRGPLTLTAKQQASPIWFWLELGKVYVDQLVLGEGRHRGWSTTMRALHSAFETHWTRWSAAERMRILLAWTLQVHGALHTDTSTSTSLWIARPITLRLEEIDTPYREIQFELQHPDAALYCHDKDPELPPAIAKKKEEEARLAEADAKIMALMGITETEMETAREID